MVETQPTPTGADRPAQRPRRIIGGLIAGALLASLVLVGLFGLPGRRLSVAGLRELTNKIDAVCGTTDGPATIDWLAGRVNFPNGTPTDLSDEQRSALGSGPKVGCVAEAIK